MCGPHRWGELSRSILHSCVTSVHVQSLECFEATSSTPKVQRLGNCGPFGLNSAEFGLQDSAAVTLKALHGVQSTGNSIWVLLQPWGGALRSSNVNSISHFCKYLP